MRTWLALALLVHTTACGGLRPKQVFNHKADLYTTEPRTLAEGGHSQEIVLPNGQTWIVTLQGWEKPLIDDLPSRSFHFEITIVDEQVSASTWRTTVLPQDALLVDDQGRKYICSRALLPKEPPETPTPEGEPALRRYTLIFALPAAYRFRLIGKLTVHWEIQVDGQLTKVSSRFQG